MKQKSKHPDWVLAQRQPKTEIRFLSGKYYLYEATSKWDPQKKRSQKITGKLLGRITPEGFVQSDKHKLRAMSNRVLKSPPVVKEFGITHLILTLFSGQIELIRVHFEDVWQEVVALSAIRLVHQAPIKNTGILFESSYLSEVFGDTTLGERMTGALYRRFGTMRKSIVSYMKNFVKEGDHLLIDATNIISHSEGIGIAHPGYNSKRDYDPQVNLMLLFSSKLQSPVYYRVIPGNIREVSAFKTTLDECGAQHVTVIADKGFYSEDNVITLEEFNAQYIIPLRRSSDLIDYSLIENKKLDKFFSFQGRYIWYTSYEIGHRKLHLFLDNNLMVREEADYLSRIASHPEEYSIEDFQQKKVRFGTIALYTNKKGSTSDKIYEDYKVRGQIETMIDAMKNTLNADTSYMQNEEAFNGWMFINFIALQFYYGLYKLLKETELLSKYSPKDIFLMLQQVRKVKINDQWITSEIPGKIKKLIEKLKIQPIT